MKFNRKVAKAVVVAVVALLAAFGIANSDKIGKVLDAAAELVPEESAPAPVGDVPADAGVSQ